MSELCVRKRLAGDAAGVQGPAGSRAGAAVMLARRDPRLAALTEEERHAIDGILRKLRTTRQMARKIKIESNTAIVDAELASAAERAGNLKVQWGHQRDT